MSDATAPRGPPRAATHLEVRPDPQPLAPPTRRSYHVFSGQLEKLATYVVQLTPEDKHLSVQELAALMRTRLRPIAVGDAAGSPGRKSATHSLSPTQLLSFALGQVMWLCAYSVGFPTSSFSLLCAAAFALLFPLAFSPRDFVSWA